MSIQKADNETDTSEHFIVTFLPVEHVSEFTFDGRRQIRIDNVDKSSEMPNSCTITGRTA